MKNKWMKGLKGFVMTAAAALALLGGLAVTPAMTAKAETTTIEAWNDADQDGVMDEGEATYASLTDAIAAGNAGTASYIRLNADVTSSTNYKMNQGTTFIIDFSGYTVTGASNYLFQVSNNSVVTLKDSTGAGGATNSSWYTLTAMSGGTLIIEGGNYDCTKAQTILVSDDTSYVNVTGGTFNNNATTNAHTFNVNGGNLSIAGGNISSGIEAAVYAASNSVVTITGGIFDNSGQLGTIYYWNSKLLDLSNHSNPSGISLYSNSSNFSAFDVLLPSEYAIFEEGISTPTTTISSSKKYTIGAYDTHKVSFDAGEGTGTMNGVNNAYTGYPLPECTFTAPEGMEFKAWSINDQEYAVGATPELTGDVTVTALWKSPNFAVTFDANGGSGSMDAALAEADGSYTLPVNTFTPPASKVFKAWEVNGAEYAPGTTVTLTVDTTVKAVWKDTYTVTFHANNGTETTDSVSNIIDDYTLPGIGNFTDFTAPTGTYFKGWSASADGEVIKTLNVTENTDVYAVWVAYPVYWGADKDNLTNYSYFSDAVAGLSSATAGYIRLREDIVLTSQINIGGGTFTIDLAGYDISYNNGTPFQIDEGAVITFEDTAEVDGTVKATLGSGSTNAITIAQEGQVIINGGNYESGIPINVSANARLTINHGSIVPSGNYTIYSSNGSITINGGSFTSGTVNVIYMESGASTLSIQGGTFTGEGSNGTIHCNTGNTIIFGMIPEGIQLDCVSGLAVSNITIPEDYIILDKDGVVFEENSFSAGMYTLALKTKYAISFDANGGSGSMDAVSVEMSSYYTLPECGFTSPDDSRYFKGWSYSADGAVIADTSILVKDPLTLYAVWELHEAKWEDTNSASNTPSYGTLEAAITAAVAGNADEIVLMRDVEDFSLRFSSGNFTLDLNGCNIKGDNEYLYVFEVNGGTVIFTDTSDTPGTVSGVDEIISNRGGNVTIKGGIYKTTGTTTIHNSANLTMTGGTVYASTYGVAISCGAGTNVTTTISNGTFIRETGARADIEYHYNAGTLKLDEYDEARGVKIYVTKYQSNISFIQLPEGYALYNLETDEAVESEITAGTYALCNNHSDIYTATKDTHTKSCACGVTITGAHTDTTPQDGECDECGYLLDGFAINVGGYSLSLEGSIGVKYYIQLDERVLADEKAYMQFYLGDKEYETQMVSADQNETTEIEGTTYYVFACHVPAKDMETEIDAELVLGDGAKSATHTYTVKEYADYILANKDQFVSGEPALVEAMIQYGEYAAAYFAGNALEATEEMNAITVDTLAPYRGSINSLVEGQEVSNYYGSSLLLKSETIMRHYFTEEISLEIQGDVKKGEQKGELWYFDALFPVGQLSYPICFDMEDARIFYNPLSYAYNVLKSTTTSDSLKNLVKALYLYEQAALDYYVELCKETVKEEGFDAGEATIVTYITPVSELENIKEIQLYIVTTDEESESEELILWPNCAGGQRFVNESAAKLKMISFEAVPEDGYTATLLYNGKALDVSTEEEFISFWEEIVATGELTISATATKIEEGTE